MRYDARTCFWENSSVKNWSKIAVPIVAIVAKVQFAGFAFESNKKQKVIKFDRGCFSQQRTVPGFEAGVRLVEFRFLSVEI